MPTDEQKRLAILSKLVIELLPKIFQIILINIAPLTEYICRLFRGNNQLTSQLNEDEVLVVQAMDAKTGYSKFSWQLGYKFFMTFWGKEPTNVENNLAEDIEQIRLLANAIISSIESTVDESLYNTFIRQIQQVTASVEFNLNLKPGDLFDDGLLEMADNSNVLNLIQTLRRQQIIEVSTKQQSKITQKERENFYRISTLIVDYANDSLRGLLDHHLTNIRCTLLQFIESKQHEIYHLCYTETCCMCPPGRTNVQKHRQAILNPSQLNILLDTTTKLQRHHSHGTSKEHCCCPANRKINYDHLDLTLTRCLLINFTNIIPKTSTERQAVDKLIEFRNKVFGHATKGAISNYDYQIYKAQIEKFIMDLAKVQHREAEFKQKLYDAAIRTLDDTIIRQYQTTLMANIEMIQDDKVTRHTVTDDKVTGRTVTTMNNTEYTFRAKSLPDCILKDLSDVAVTEGRDAYFEIWTKAVGRCAIWSKNGSELVDSKFLSERSGTIHSLHIRNTCLADKGLYTVTVNDTERHARLHIEEYFTKNPQSMECIEGEKVEFICEVVEKSLPACWNRNGQNLENDGKYEMLQVEKCHRLSILNCDLQDAGDYTVNINNRVRTTSLIVNEYFTKNLERTYEYREGDTVKLSCEVLDSNVAAIWEKDGVVIQHSARYNIRKEGRTQELSIIKADVSDAGNYRIKIANRMRVTSIQVNEIPAAIGQLSENEKSQYLKIIKSGTETRYSMRVPIIGENGVGKTSLMRRLLGDTIADVKSTDGIDIVHRCKIRLDDGKWFVDKGTDKRKDMICRIKRAVDENLSGISMSQNESMRSVSDSSKVGSSDSSENRQNRQCTSTVFVENKVDTISTEDQMDVTESPKSDGETEKNSDAFASVEGKFKQSSSFSQSNQLLMAVEKPESKLSSALSETILHELSKFINDIVKYEVTEEVLVGCGFWDFAGEKHYYPTHPIFLNPYALHLLVVDIMKDIKQISPENGYDKIGEYIDFWLDSIHSFGAINGTMDSTADYLNPPVILVCTGIDKCQNELDERKTQFSKQLQSLLDTENKRKHLRRICYVSNTHPEKEDFEYLRQSIFDFGKKIKGFGEKIPLRWIRLEQSIDVVQCAGVKILSWSDITQLASKCSIDDTSEIHLFLKYQHNVGNIIYFERLKEFIVLNQKWLADALRCFVSDKYADDVKFMPEWKTLVDTGELTSPLIKKLFQKDRKYEFDKHEDHLLKVMEMFGIIVKLTTLMENGQKESLKTYFMPCMISEKSSITQLYDLFGVKRIGCVLTPWLCIEFDFMPFDFFNHIFSHYARQYPICIEAKSRKNAIYHGMGVFFYDNSKQRKFILCFSKNTIGIQMWQWKKLEQGKFKAMLEELMSVVHHVKNKCEPRRVSFSVKVKCAKGSLHVVAGRQSYMELTILGKKEYFCEDHNEMHGTTEFFQTWFEDYFENKEEQPPLKKIKADSEGPISAQSVVCNEEILYARIPVDKTKEIYRGKQNFNQMCDVCSNKSTACWCHDCKKSMCNDCRKKHSDSDDNSSHILQHVNDMYALNSKFKVDVGLITDVKVFHDRLLVMADWNGKQLVTCHITGQEQCNMALTCAPYRMAVVDKHIAAVTLPVIDTILIVNVRERQVLKRIEAKVAAGGIMFRDGDLFLGIEKAIKIIDISGQFKRTIPVGNVSNYICGGEAGNIFYTDLDKLYCIDSEGNTLVTCNDSSMRMPRLITKDDEGHLLVLCEKSNNIFRVSPDGKKSSVIIAEIPPHSWSPHMCYDSVSQSVVICRDKTVYLYKKL